MIITCKKEIPTRWIAFSILPWASFSYTWGVAGTVFLFSLRKFIDNPAGLTFILSLPAFSSIIVDPCTSFLSDRIWTRFGRRKPFIVTSWTGAIVCLALLPLMPNFWSLLAVFLAYNIFSDLNSPLEPLKQEIIPPHERGRATGAMQWLKNLANITFYVVALGRFDDVRYMAGVPFFGEQMIYWSAVVMVSVMLLLIVLGIREVDPKSELRGQRLSVRNFFGGLLDRELWPVYMLVFGSAVLNSGLGPLGMLLYTEQWAYTKQEMGANVAIGGVINLFIIGFLTIFADRLNRAKAYRILITLSVCVQALYFVYVTYVLPDQRPSLVELILFGEIGSIIGILTTMVYVPMVYDYVRRNKMGTYAAGANMVNKITHLVTLNGVGLFVWAYATMFEPPAGEMARVVLRGEAAGESEVRAVVDKGAWAVPQSGDAVPASKIKALTWQADGTVSATGHCWEVRMRNDSSKALAQEKESLEKERIPLMAAVKYDQDRVEILTRKGHMDGVAPLKDAIRQKQRDIGELDGKIAALHETLDKRAAQFSEQVTRAFGGRLIAEGEQLEGARLGTALLVEIGVAHRPNTRELEKMLGVLRAQDANILDLRPQKGERGYAVVLSAALSPGESESDVAGRLRNAATRCAPGLLKDADILSSVREPLLSMDLMVIEEPLVSHVSPVTRAVNGILGWFDAAPSADRKLQALARSLRVPGEINHVRVEPGRRSKVITVAAALPSSAPKAAAGDAMGRRIGQLLTADASVVSQARAFFSRIEENAAVQRLTVAKPVIAAAYAPMKYNYMCGYFWMFLLGLIGIGITLLFSRFEARGLIAKRGVEEAQAE